MKINELMVGDWVKVPSELNRYKRIISTFDMDSSVLYKPIPLTTKILKKIGWEKCNIDVVDDDEQYGCAYGPFYFTWWRKVKLLSCYFDDMNAGLHYEMISELPTKYVHQLQHALKLCGIDKEIEL